MTHPRPQMLRGLLMGCPGSGKGTQAKRISEKFNFSIFSSGDCLRRQINAKTSLGLAVDAILKRGELVPDSIVTPVVLDKVRDLLHSDTTNISWLLDGFPRTISQARALDEFLLAAGKPLNFVIDLDVPHSAILQRIQDRYVHAPSGRVYNLQFNPPLVPGKDDVTGQTLTKRPDDNAEVVKKRLEKYTEATRPLIAYYQNMGVLHQFKGDSSDEITPQIFAAIDRFIN